MGQQPRPVAAIFAALFTAHQWGSAWRNDIYNVHHDHGTGHEVLGIYREHARVQCGSEKGVMLPLGALRRPATG